MTGKKKNIVASIHQRLLNKAKETDRPFNELLQFYGIERFLYRMSISSHVGDFVLKGALMLLAWKIPRTRPTMDIDFLGFTDNSLENLDAVIQAVCRIDNQEDDGVQFDSKTVKAVRIKEDAEYEGIRVTFMGHLGNAKIPMQIDVGFNDAVTPSPQIIDYPVILNSPVPQLRGYNRETMIAEKFEAMVKLGEFNSRMKDFFDIWLLSRQFDFSSVQLAKACRKTLSRRGTDLDELPYILKEKFAGANEKQKQWSAFIRKSRIDYAPEKFYAVTTQIRDFMEPIVSSIVASDTSNAIWTAPGPWRPMSKPLNHE